MRFYILYIFIILLFEIQILYAQPGEPFHPATANGAINIGIIGHTLVWENPAGTVYNRIYISDDSIKVINLNPEALLKDGFPNTVYTETGLQTIEPLESSKKYYWRIVEYNYTGSNAGPVWNFQTRNNPSSPILFEDNFESNDDSLPSGWLITNDEGTGVWGVYPNPGQIVWPNIYTLPCGAECGKILSADSDYWGNGSTLLSTATINETFIMPVFGTSLIEFDNDFRIRGADDAAYIEVSINNGNSWHIVWQQVGTALRNTHESVDISQMVLSNPFKIRFRSVQPGWDWWWTIDNVKIFADYPASLILPPNYLASNSDNDSSLRVNLTWTPAIPSQGPYAVSGYEIQRKQGLPLSSSQYVVVDTTNAQTLTWIDSLVEQNQVYTYKVRAKHNLYYGYFSNENTAYIPAVIPVEFILFTAFADINKITLNWSTAAEINNQGFEILRHSSNSETEWKKIGFVEGKGTVTETSVYSFTDDNLMPGKYKYRLKQVDYNGIFEFSDIIETEIAPPSEFSLKQNYPNPFNPVTTIRYSVPKVSHINISVFNMLGEEVIEILNEDKTAGIYDTQFNASGLASGTYIIRMKTDDFNSSVKIILMK